MTKLSARAAETRAAILEAGRSSFLSAGYGGTTLAGVAERASVSTATLHKYFPTKRALFGGVMECFWAEEGGSEPPSPPTGDPSTGILSIGRAYADLLSSDDIVALFRTIIAESISAPELGEELYEKGKKPYLERLEAYIQSEFEAGSLDVDDIPLAVRQYLGMINDVIFWPRLLLPGRKLTQDEVENVVRRATETFLKAYLK